MTFTNQNNVDYLTADSAYALYYNMGNVSMGEAKKISTSYGVYSNANVAIENGIAFNVVAPKSLTLSEDSTMYAPVAGAVGSATFPINVSFENIAGREINNVSIAVYTHAGITAMDDDGNELTPKPTYEDPYYSSFYSLKSGEIRSHSFQLKADVSSSATYRKIELRAFDTSEGGQIQFSDKNLIGIKTLYVLCPGGEGDLPKVTFTGADPKVLYYKGLNHYIVKGNNFQMLENKAEYQLVLENVNDQKDCYIIPSDNIIVNSAEGTLDIILDREFETKTYKLYLEWANTAPVPKTEKYYTAPSLSLTFSKDEAYKLNSYGVLTVYQDKSDAPNQKYYIKEFKTEADFKTFKSNKENYSEILLEFRGQFIEDIDQTTGYTLEKHFTAASNKPSDVITVNNCLDFEMGTLRVYYDDKPEGKRSVMVDFNGSLYTSVERTFVWEGKASLTEITDGKEFSLVQYAIDGKRKTQANTNNISLVWPQGANIGQSLAGMIFNLGYGTLGVIDEKGVEEGRVIGFTASFDFGFLLPNASDKKGNRTDSKFKRIKEAFNFGENDYTNADLRTRAAVLISDNELTNEENKQQAAGTATAAVTVDDVLFGCGVGFYGFRFDVNVVLPSYTDSMPKIAGRLVVNTIRNWSFDVSGSVVFSDLTFGAEIKVKSYNNIPIPDKLFVYAKSGGKINVDGAGVVWITGGGGGFDNLYDSVICAKTLPTIKLLLRLYFEIYLTLEGQADASFSLQGFSVAMTNLKIKETGISVIPSLSVDLKWLPTFESKSALVVNLFGFVTGGGYIVVLLPSYDSDTAFVEGFIKAKVAIPKKYGIIGGLTVAGAELGVNSDKIWGNIKFLDAINVGIIYYWGNSDSLKFGVNVEGGNPTFPGLLPGLAGYNAPVPVGYDKKTDKTLYMQMCTNFAVAANAQVMESFDELPVLMGNDPFVRSDMSLKKHELNLGDYKNKSGVFTLSFDAENENHAKELADQFTFNLEKENVAIKYYNPEASDNTDANANLTYDEDTKKATLAIFAVSAGQFNKTWSIQTGVTADAVIFDIVDTPEINTVTAKRIDDSIDVSWDGKILEELDSVSFYLTKNQSSSEDIDEFSVFLGVIKDKADIVSKSKAFNIPESLPGGEYYLRMVYNKDGAVCASQTSTDTISHTNKNQPNEQVTINSVKNSGDLCFDISLSPIRDADGYLINIYNADGTELTDIHDLTFDAGSNEETTVSAGGSFSIPTVNSEGIPEIDSGGNAVAVTKGLKENTEYVVEAMTFNNVDSDGVVDYVLKGTPTRFSPVTLNAATPSNVKISPNEEFKNIDKNVSNQDVSYNTFNTDKVSFSAASDNNEKLSGTWSIGNSYENEVDGMWGSFSDLESVSILPNTLTDGNHRLRIWGRDETGDSFNTDYEFAIDTKAPVLLVSTPLNGGVFSESGKVNITGIMDKKALITLIVDENVIFTDTTIEGITGATTDEFNNFTIPLTVDDESSKHTIKLIAKDDVGNSVDYTAMLSNAGLGNIKSIDIYRNDGGEPTLLTNQDINCDDNISTQLSIVANTKSGNKVIVTDPMLVNWSCVTVSGDALITPDGQLNVISGSSGFVQGALCVSSIAAMTSAISFSSNKESTDPDTPSLTPDGGGGGGGSVSSLGSVVKSVTSGDTVQMKLPDKTRDYCVYYYNSNKEAVPVIFSAVTDDGLMTFIAPVSAKYYLREIQKIDFDDVPQTHYAKKYIDFGVSRRLFSGIGNNLFSPDGSTTRAMFVTLLWRLSGSPSVEGNMFEDVLENTWYSEAVKWALKTEISTGYGNNLFGTNDFITREQMCTMLMRYIDKMEYKLNSSSSENNFEDKTKISDWAIEAVEECIQNGLIKGNEKNMFMPLDFSTRSQLTIVMDRLIESILNSKLKS